MALTGAAAILTRSIIGPSASVMPRMAFSAPPFDSASAKSFSPALISGRMRSTNLPNAGTSFVPTTSTIRVSAGRSLMPTSSRMFFRFSRNADSRVSNDPDRACVVPPNRWFRTRMVSASGSTLNRVLSTMMPSRCNAVALPLAALPAATVTVSRSFPVALAASRMSGVRASVALPVRPIWMSRACSDLMSSSSTPARFRRAVACAFSAATWSCVTLPEFLIDCANIFWTLAASCPSFTESASAAVRVPMAPTAMMAAFLMPVPICAPARNARDSLLNLPSDACAFAIWEVKFPPSVSLTARFAVSAKATGHSGV